MSQTEFWDEVIGQATLDPTFAIPTPQHSEVTPEDFLAYVAVAELDKPFCHPRVAKGLLQLSAQLDPHILNYNVLIADDTSARLPALVLRGVMNSRRAQLGTGPVALRFANGASSEPLPKGYLPNPQPTTQRALIFTEYVSSGESAQNLYHAVRQQRSARQIDFATLGGTSNGIANLPHRFSPQSIVFSNSEREFMYIDGQLHSDEDARVAKGVIKQWSERFARKRPLEIYNGQAARKARQDAKALAELITQALS